MSLLRRLFAPSRDPRDELRPLWSTIVGEARQPHWYEACGVADTLEGRFDMVTAVLALVLLRMERVEALAARTAPLAEIFVEEMDGQLRQSGVGDLMVGKQIGKLMGTLGGRTGALRQALAGKGQAEGASLVEVAERNVTLADPSRVGSLAEGLRVLAQRLEDTPDASLLAGQIA